MEEYIKKKLLFFTREVNSFLLEKFVKRDDIDLGVLFIVEKIV